jgi:hypothetical protein
MRVDSSTGMKDQADCLELCGIDLIFDSHRQAQPRGRLKSAKSFHACGSSSFAPDRTVRVTTGDRGLVGPVGEGKAPGRSRRQTGTEEWTIQRRHGEDAVGYSAPSESGQTRAMMAFGRGGERHSILIPIPLFLHPGKVKHPPSGGLSFCSRLSLPALSTPCEEIL